jgi:photosystem II stability/assembly factor-like uncharacterized protein
MEYWMGTTGGGVYKTTDGGLNWSPASDRYFGGTIGAITVDPNNPDVVLGRRRRDLLSAVIPRRRRRLEDDRRGKTGS